MSAADPDKGRRRLRDFGARRSTFWWVALIVVLVIVLVQGGMLMVYMHEQFIARVQGFTDTAVERAANVRSVIANAPPAMRPQLLEVLQDRYTRLTLTARPATSSATPWQHTDRVHDQIDFSQLPEDARLVIAEAPGREDSGRPGALMISLPTQGQWLNVTYRLDPRDRGGSMRVVFWALLITLIACAVALIAVRRATRPLRLLADAAQRLGTDLHAPALPERGGRETRLAVRAFNDMQQRIRDLLADRTRMLGALSHDLRTQLTRLRLRVDEIPDPEHRAWAEAEMRTMQAMVEGALAFARDDFTDESPREFDLAALLATLCDERADSGETVTCEAPDRLPFRGRPVALRRALDNLIGNAVRYGGEARVRLQDQGELVVIEVEDRGPGIAAGERERVLQPFARLEGSRNQATGGAGLGLAIAAGAVRAHDGRLQLLAAEPRGLRVRVELPRRAQGAAR